MADYESSSYVTGLYRQFICLKGNFGTGFHVAFDVNINEG